MPTSNQTLHAIREPLKAVDGLGRQVHFAFEYLRDRGDTVRKLLTGCDLCV